MNLIGQFFVFGSPGSGRYDITLKMIALNLHPVYKLCAFLVSQIPIPGEPEAHSPYR